MVPDTKTLMSYRVLAAGMIRFAGVLAVPGAMIPWGSWLFEGLRDGDLWWWSYYMSRIVTGAFFFVLAAVFLAIPRALARVLVPIRPPAWPPRCPSCRYRLVTLRQAVCPECGLPLPEEVVADSEGGHG